jgi:hypothetical protein
VAGKSGPATRDPRSDRTGRDVEYRRDLGVVEAGEVPQHDRRPELLRQPLEGGVDVDPVGHIVVDARWAAARGLLELRQTGIRPATPPAELVEAGVRRHPIRPRAERGSTVEPGQAAHQGDQGLLSGVEGVGLVARESPADRVDPVVVPAEKRVEGALIASLGRRDQGMVIGAAPDARSLGTLPVRSR